MENNTPKHREVAIVRPENSLIFELYSVWKALPLKPVLFMGKKVSTESVFEEMEIEDPLFREALRCKTQKAFAERFGLSQDTLTDWNRKIEGTDPLKEARKWARKLTKNVVFNLYYQAAYSDNPHMMKLFLQVINDWHEKTTPNIHVPDVHIQIVPMRTRAEMAEEARMKVI
jgi:hypothetical protein